MPKPVKIEAVKTICEKLKATKVCVLLENHGLNVKQANALRKSVREANGEIRVYKNTLLNIALKETSEVELDPKVFKGATMVGFAYEDPIQMVKAVADFQKEKENTDKISFKAGIMDEKALSDQDLVALSKLPGREALLSMLLNVMQQPATNIVRVLSAPARDLVCVLSAYQKKLEENN